MSQTHETLTLIQASVTCGVAQRNRTSVPVRPRFEDVVRLKDQQRASIRLAAQGSTEPRIIELAIRAVRD